MCSVQLHRVIKCVFAFILKGLSFNDVMRQRGWGSRTSDVCQIFDDKGRRGASQKVTMHDISRKGGEAAADKLTKETLC